MGEQPALAEFEEKFNLQLLERLKTLTPNFLSIRSAMGIDGKVGFSFLPDTHGVYSLGTLPLLKKSGDGDWCYPVWDTLGGLFGSDYVPFTDEDWSRVVVKPDNSSPKPRLVSIYQRKGYKESQVVEDRLLTAPNEVFEGVIAHELAHMFKLGEPKPSFIENFLHNRKMLMDKLVAEYSHTFLDEFDTTDEAEADVIAALFGYKEQILAKNYYMIDCLRGYIGADDRGNSLFKTPGRATKELQVRIKEVERFCPSE